MADPRKVNAAHVLEATAEAALSTSSEKRRPLEPVNIAEKVQDHVGRAVSFSPCGIAVGRVKRNDFDIAVLVGIGKIASTTWP